MKTAQKKFAQAINALKLEIPESIALSIFELLLQSQQEYAIEAIKADRERVIGVLRYPFGYIDGEIQNADRILNLPIELP